MAISDDTVALVLHCDELAAVDALRRVVHSIDGFRVLTGRGEWTALVYDPPGFPGEEETVMKALSESLPGEHFSLHTWEGDENVVWYAGGDQLRRETRRISSVVEEFGFAPDDADGGLDVVVWSAVLVPGADAQQHVAAALERVEPEIARQLTVSTAKQTTLVVHPTADIGLVYFQLLEQGCTELVNLLWKSNGEFMAVFDSDDGEQTVFAYPPPSAQALEDEPELLADVDGETVPSKIALRLGVGRELLPGDLP